MFEDRTFEMLLERMKNKISPKIDKREGAVIYDALAPAALEFQNGYIEMDVILRESFGDTASREWLILRAKERNLYPNKATKTILRGEFTPTSLEIPIGSFFTLEDLKYEVIEKIYDGNYKVECTTAGEIGNRYFGNLIPVDYIAGLETAQLTEILIYGEDEEETEAFRKRYLNSFKTKSFAGNKKDYMDLTNSISGVGATKVTRTWQGGGTVKLTILSSHFTKASDVLIELVQNTIDPKQDGEGDGLAPIGHVVTVDTAEEVIINITAHVIFENGYTFNNISSQVFNLIDEYMKELRKTWENEENIVIRKSYIDTKFLQIKGVLDIADVSINNTSGNFVLSKYQIPILGGVTNI